MSLDGLIMRRSSSERGRVQGRGMGRGWGQGLGDTFVGRGVRMLHRGPLRINRLSPFKIAKSFSRTKDLLWRHDLFVDSMAVSGLSGAEGGTKLYISNLDYGVSNEDIKGSAEVVYTRRSDAIAAVKRYNNVQLDGKPMKIEIIGNNLGLPIAPRVNVVGGANGRGKRTVVMTHPRIWSRCWVLQATVRVESREKPRPRPKHRHGFCSRTQLPWPWPWPRSQRQQQSRTGAWQQAAS